MRDELLTSILEEKEKLLVFSFFERVDGAQERYTSAFNNYLAANWFKYEGSDFWASCDATEYAVGQLELYIGECIKLRDDERERNDWQLQ